MRLKNVITITVGNTPHGINSVNNGVITNITINNSNSINIGINDIKCR